MAKPYSMDLRERVSAAVVRGGMSCRQAAKPFGVAVSTSIGWVKRVRETGNARPGKMGGHRPRKITGQHREWLIARCKSADFTLRGLVLELAERGLKVDYRTMWAFVHAEDLSYKKNLSGQRARPARRCASARTMAALSGPDRSCMPGVHR